MTTTSKGAVPLRERAGSREGSVGAVISFGLSAVALGLLLGTGPISIFPAILGVLGGTWTLYRLHSSAEDWGGKGMATAAVILGLLVGALSVIIVAGSQAA